MIILDDTQTPNMSGIARANHNMPQSRMLSPSGTLPESPETPNWGPPTGGTLPESPETPNWGPPTGGTLPESPEIPNWGPPTGGTLPESPEIPNWGPPMGGTLPESPEIPNWGPPTGGTLPESPETPNWGPPTEIPGWPLPPIVIQPGTSAGYCSVRFLYAGVDQPAVNISIGNRTIIRDFRYADVTPYYRQSAGRYVTVTLTATYTGEIVGRTQLALKAGYVYTIALVNQTRGLGLFVTQDLPCENANRFGCVRAINLSVGGKNMDVFLTGVGRAFRDVAPFEVTPYRNIISAAYRAFVSEALPCISSGNITIGNTYVECNNTQIAILDSTVLNVKTGLTYTLYIIGRPYSYPALQILPLESDLVY